MSTHHIPTIQGALVGNGSTPESAVNVPTRQGREQAVREAQECLHALNDQRFQLDGFNLLGVVANPRSGMIGPNVVSGHTPSSAYQENSSSQPSSPCRQELITSSTTQSSPSEFASAVTPENEPGMFSDAVQTIEYTLAQVTEQIETLNLFLEELSRQYLGDDNGESLFLEYYYQDEGDNILNPESEHVHPQLTNLQLQDLQSYLEECGVLAFSLFAQGLTTRTLDQDVAPKEELNELLRDIPGDFYNEDFDLTNSLTFVELLLDQDIMLNEHPSCTPEDQRGSMKSSSKDKGKKKTRNALYQSALGLVPVREPDSLASYLDRVELALQDQVRQKSTVFFHETNRFRQLQTSIEDLLQQVQSLRSCMQQALGVYRQTKDISNHQRQDYEHLVDLLDAAMELVRCKASIGGLLSANDYQGAAQQIQYGRRLLLGTDRDSEDSKATIHVNGTASNVETTSGDDLKNYMKLMQLKSLSNSADQFGQYELLVVQSLSEELVEILFNWRPSDKERVQEMVQALNLCQAMDKTAELYQRRLQQTIRMTVRTTIAEFVESSGSGGSGGVSSLTYSSFSNCLSLLIEEIHSILKTAFQVDEFFVSEKVVFVSNALQKRWTEEAVAQGADLAAKSIAELLRLRKESHALISQSEMKQLWDTCLTFTTEMECYCNSARAVGLRSTLAGQAKAWLDRSHESNMSSLVAALDSERWSQCEVSAERQAALTRLCTGLATISAPVRNLHENGNEEQCSEKNPSAVVEGVQYKVVWSCLLLVEMVMTNLSAAAHFQTLAPNAVTKVVELLRLWNSRTASLVLGAGAINSAARLKSINAKHLSYVTQCLGIVMALLPHIRAALMAQLPAKQHTLVSELDKIKKEYHEHNDKILNKFVSIIGGIVESGLAPRIANTDFAAREKDFPLVEGEDMKCCVFLEGISNSTRKLHQVLSALLPPDHLQDVFSRIFAYLDEKIPVLFIAATATQSNGSPSFQLPTIEEGKKRFILEVMYTTRTLNALGGVHPWDFTAMTVLERKMDYKLPDSVESTPRKQSNASVMREEEPVVLECSDKVASSASAESVPDPSTRNEDAGFVNGKAHMPTVLDSDPKKEKRDHVPEENKIEVSSDR